jgi:hypothetical protein
MNNTNPPVVRLSIALAAASLIATALWNPAIAQDKAKPAIVQDKAKPATAAAKSDVKDQRDRKVLVENDKVLVTEVSYKPGLSSAMSERGPRVTRALTDGTLERTYPDGRKETINWKAGQVRFNPKETFMQKNVGKSEVILYTVTIK